MAECQCGASNLPDARFCSACGAALGDGSGLLGVSATVSEVTTDAGIDRRWALIAIALFAVLVGWSMWSGGSGDAPSAGDIADENRTTTSITTPSTASTQTTATPTPTAPTTTATPTTATSATTRVMGSATVRVIDDGNPVLGEPTGLSLVIGRTSHGPTVLDLDAGLLVEAPTRPRGLAVMLISGDWLVGSDNGRLLAVPRTDLAADPIELLADEDEDWLELADATPRDDGRAWAIASDGTNARLRLVDLASGTAVESIDFDWLSGTNWAAGGSSAVLPLLDPAAGGVYEFDGSSYREVADGRMVVADDRRVLLEVCDTRFACRQQWFDRQTWEPIDLFVPPALSRNTVFLNGSDWLQLYWFTSSSVEAMMFDVSTGASRDVDDQLNFGSAAAVSPDGRWLAETVGQDLIIVDLTTGEERRFDGLAAYGDSMLFTTEEVGYRAAGEGTSG